MMFDMIRDLNTIYYKVQSVDENTEPILSQAECLLQGVRSKVYKKLLERDTCGKLFFFNVNKSQNVDLTSITLQIIIFIF